VASPLKLRWRTIFAAGVLILLIVPLVGWLRLPRYKGRTIVFWWDEYVTSARFNWNPINAAALEERGRRTEDAMKALSAMEADAGEFLLGQIEQGGTRDAYWKFWRWLSPGARQRFGKVLPEPIDPGEHRNQATMIFWRLPKALGAVKRRLLALAVSPDREVASIALFLLRDRPDLSDCVDEVGECLHSPHGEVIEWSAYKLGESGVAARKFAPDIRAAIRTGKISASSGVRTLSRMGEPLWTCIPALNEELSQKNRPAEAALSCVTLLGSNAKYVSVGLSNALQYPDARFNARVIHVIGGLGEEARPLAPALANGLGSEWYFLRAESINALVQMGGLELFAAASRITALCNDPHPDVSNAVLRAMMVLNAEVQ
jgi:hypothetical protein